MYTVALLMNEHGIIKLMMDLMKEKVETKPQESLTPAFIDITVDFFRVYADRCHHGKEEGIFFRDLANKQLSSDLRKMMDELILEHAYARRAVDELEDAQRKHVQRKPETLREIEKTLKRLIDFYPRHIEKENTRFFYQAMEYLSDQELDNMAEEFLRFDGRIIHFKYVELVERLKGR